MQASSGLPNGTPVHKTLRRMIIPAALSSCRVRRVLQMFGQALAVVLGIGFLTLQVSSATRTARTRH